MTLEKKVDNLNEKKKNNFILDKYLMFLNKSIGLFRNDPETSLVIKEYIYKKLSNFNSEIIDADYLAMKLFVEDKLVSNLSFMEVLEIINNFFTKTIFDIFKIDNSLKISKEIYLVPNYSGDYKSLFVHKDNLLETFQWEALLLKPFNFDLENMNIIKNVFDIINNVLKAPTDIVLKISDFIFTKIKNNINVVFSNVVTKSLISVKKINELNYEVLNYDNIIKNIIFKNEN